MPRYPEKGPCSWVYLKGKFRGEPCPSNGTTKVGDNFFCYKHVVRARKRLNDKELERRITIEEVDEGEDINLEEEDENIENDLDDLEINDSEKDYLDYALNEEEDIENEFNFSEEDEEEDFLEEGKQFSEIPDFDISDCFTDNFKCGSTSLKDIRSFSSIEEPIPKKARIDCETEEDLRKEILKIEKRRLENAEKRRLEIEAKNEFKFTYAKRGYFTCLEAGLDFLNKKKTMLDKLQEDDLVDLCIKKAIDKNKDIMPDPDEYPLQYLAFITAMAILNAEDKPQPKRIEQIKQQNNTSQEARRNVTPQNTGTRKQVFI